MPCSNIGGKDVGLDEITKSLTMSPTETGRKPQLAYILASSHSGSTLLAMLLASHPAICSVGELKATSFGDPTQYRCSCGELIAACSFWRAISRRLAAAGFVFDIANARTNVDSDATAYMRRLLRPLHRGWLLEVVRDIALHVSPRWRNHLRNFRRLNDALVRALIAQTGKTVVVDSSKIGIRLKYLLRTPTLDVRVIRLIRDGRAVALTYTDPEQYADSSDRALRGGGNGSSREGERIPLTDAVHEWRRSTEEAEAIVSQLDPSRHITVSYEELCASPDSTLQRIFAFLEVAPCRESIRHWRTQQHHVVGNGMRFDTTAQIELDQRWRSALTTADLNVFRAEAGILNRRLGYR